ncbi:coiled-coil domain-containing protein 57-like [Liolophura sinensis]|uniref:coiled-coil domain-containing protein 57-like n=1 Tax=Liolophura sinensis TaxID=3198878 RepID=UPI0031588F0E
METKDLKELASQKEKEWRDVTELRIQTLETDSDSKTKLLEEERNKFVKLKEDFKYNLKLLGERDKELEQYDVIFAELKQKITILSTENSELKIKIDELKVAHQREAKSREDLQTHYQQRLREKQREIDNFRKDKEGQVEEERKEYESFKRKLEKRLTEVEEELEIQKRELTTGFDEAIRKREHEFRLKIDEMNSQVLAHQFQAKLLAKELEMFKAAQNKTSQEFQQVETNHKELEKSLRKKDWELADLKSVKDARIAELEAGLSRAETKVKQLQEEFQKRYTEMDRYSREKEASLKQIKESYGQKEESYKQSIHELEGKLEQRQIEIRQLQWANQDLGKEKELQIEKLSGELCELREKWDRQVSELSRDQVSKDVFCQDMRLQVEKLTQQLTERTQDIARYKRDLSSALDREAALERSKAQLELDWQRRFEDVEGSAYSKSEELVAKLTAARDQAVATLKEKERECADQGEIIQQLKKQKAQAMATLQQHGIQPSGSFNAWPLDEAVEVEELRIQNQNLIRAVTEMRQAMEELGHGVTVSEANNKSVTVTRDYTSSLENQVLVLKKEKRSLEQEIEELKKPDYEKSKVQPTEVISEEVNDNVVVRSHIQSLNDMIGALRAEKVELTAQLKKQQARIQFLERSTEDFSKQQRQKQLELDQSQYELNAEGRRHKAESAALRQRITELELEVAETRKEADEYYRGGLERNMEVTALRAELSNLKLELAQKRPAINFGAQELVIQQLEDEIHRLRKQSHVTSSEPIRSGQGQTTNATLEQLQTKLKSAAKHIAQLARDKQHLIEIGNRQRAELLKAGIAPPSADASSGHIMYAQGNRQGLFPMSDQHSFPKSNPVDTPSHPLEPPSHQLTGAIQDKLDALEKLQYQLTTQELQYAQKFSPKRAARRQKAVQSSSEEEYRPVSILKRSGESFISDGGFGDTLSSVGEAHAGRDLRVSLSSAGAESLQEVWQVLNQPSPSPVPPTQPEASPGRDTPQSSVEWTVKGRKAGVTHISQAKPTVKQKQNYVVKKPQQKAKIRNYNVKTDIR